MGNTDGKSMGNITHDTNTERAIPIYRKHVVLASKTGGLRCSGVWPLRKQAFTAREVARPLSVGHFHFAGLRLIASIARCHRPRSESEQRVAAHPFVVESPVEPGGSISTLNRPAVC